jgi:galactokinase
MREIAKLVETLENGSAARKITEIYGSKKGTAEKQKSRFLNLLNSFKSLYPEHDKVELFSAPGRTEIGGNHTDHNAGRILAGAVDLDVIAAVAPNGCNIISISSEGYDGFKIDLSKNLDARQEEKYSPSSIVRGVCSRFSELGLKISGFDAYISSTVPKGSGLSSSAAFEVMIVTILNNLFNESKVDTIYGAIIAQYSENNYFGKPCGLMDPTTSAVGGLIAIDFKDFDDPIVKKVEYDFGNVVFSIVIVDTGGNHADLNDDYTALENEMKAVAKALGGKVLREFSLSIVLDNISFLRKKVNDRAILRAVHFFNDDARVVEQVKALENNDFPKFLQLVTESGYSSWMLCQNCYLSKHFEEQGVSVGLALSEEILRGKGAWRVHGGGFAGTIQAFVPNQMVDEYILKLSEIFGPESCHELVLRNAGAIMLDLG